MVFYQPFHSPFLSPLLNLGRLLSLGLVFEDLWPTPCSRAHSASHTFWNKCMEVARLPSPGAMARCPHSWTPVSPGTGLNSSSKAAEPVLPDGETTTQDSPFVLYCSCPMTAEHPSARPGGSCSAKGRKLFALTEATVSLAALGIYFWAVLRKDLLMYPRLASKLLCSQ